jgi:exopolyphosphatase/guanosine-5'-triphosphate,3'-diphosphate pyrophosphatase
MLHPVIDVGSNTVKIAVLDEETLFHEAPVFFKAVPLKIKAIIVENRLPDHAMEELADLMKEFSDIAGRLTKVSPIAFATASLRGLENLDDVREKVKEKSGINIEVISG